MNRRALIFYLTILALQNIKCVISEDDDIEPKRLYLGCYRDDRDKRVLNGYNTEGSMTPRACIKICKDLAFLYAGVQYSKECHCGHFKPSDSLKVSESECNAKCSGNQNELCGGDFRLNVYVTVERKDVYYWQDFQGFIPNTAFSAGTDLTGIPTYIGQTFFEDKNQTILPTIISKFELPHVVVDDQIWQSFEYTKILCSTNNDLFRWISVNPDNINYLTGCELVPGGWDGEKLIIGRANVQGAKVTGRVYGGKNIFGLIIHDSYKQSYLTKQFEVLAFNCTTPFNT